MQNQQESESYHRALQTYIDLDNAKRSVKSAFRALDTDGDSCLSMSEFRTLLDTTHIRLNDQDFAYFFNMNQKDGKINYSLLREAISQHVRSDPLSGRSVLNTSALMNESVNEPFQDDHLMLRLDDVKAASNPYMNPYNHSRPQNVSHIDSSFIDNHAFNNTVYRTGHYSRIAPRADDSPETSSITRDLLNYDFRPNVEFVHKEMIVSSATPIAENALHSFVNALQQELVGVAVLRYSSFYQVVDTSNENKCVVTTIWAPVLETASLSAVVDTTFGKASWRRICDRFLLIYNLKCDWMVDIHPNYSNCKFLVY